MHVRSSHSLLMGYELVDHRLPITNHKLPITGRQPSKSPPIFTELTAISTNTLTRINRQACRGVRSCRRVHADLAVKSWRQFYSKPGIPFCLIADPGVLLS